jgi:hypothetical protein
VDYCLASDGGGMDFGMAEMKERGTKVHKGPSIRLLNRTACED